MKVLHLGKYYWPEYGGMETALQQIAEAGVRLGHEVRCVVAQQPGLPEKLETINGVEVLRLATYAKVLSAPLSPYYRAWGAGCDVLHVHLPHPVAELESLRAAAPNAKLIPYFHAYPVRQRWLGSLWFGQVTARLLNQAKGVLVSNPEVPKAFPQLSPWASKVKVLPFSTNCLDAAAMQKFAGVRRESRLVLAVGRLVGYKGFDVLIEAWRKMSLAGWRLKIVGEGPERENLERLIVRDGLTESVELVGQCTEQRKTELLREAALFVAPSTTEAETFGISILEAMGFGLPVVTTTLRTGVALLARGGECGAAVQPGDSVALARALSGLLESPERRAACGESNLRFARENYSAATLSTAYEDILKCA